MKKLLCTFLSVLILATMSITTYASSTRAITIAPTLSFENATAYCEVMLTANYPNDVIRAVVRLCYEGDSIKVWYTSSESGVLAFERSYDISDYGTGTYEITVDFTINNESYPRASMEREYQGG